MKNKDEIAPPMLPVYGEICQRMGGTSPSLHGEEKFGCGWRRICAFISLNAFSWLYAYVSKNVEHINALTLIFISLNSAIIKICHKNTLR